MKICTKCKERKAHTNFHKCKSYKDGLSYVCKLCRKNDIKAKEWAKKYAQDNKEVRNERSRLWNESNKDVSNKRARDWHYANREKSLQQKKDYYVNNREHLKEATKRWVKENPELVRAKRAKYRASKLNRTPKWLTEEDFSTIRAYYRVAQKLTEVTGEQHHVDHIIPLQGKLISGLHCPTNLQVLKATDNHSKSNKIDLEELNS